MTRSMVTIAEPAGIQTVRRAMHSNGLDIRRSWGIVHVSEMLF